MLAGPTRIDPIARSKEYNQTRLQSSQVADVRRGRARHCAAIIVLLMLKCLQQKRCRFTMHPGSRSGYLHDINVLRATTPLVETLLDQTKSSRTASIPRGSSLPRFLIECSAVKICDSRLAINCMTRRSSCVDATEVCLRIDSAFWTETLAPAGLEDSRVRDSLLTFQSVVSCKQCSQL